MTVQVAAHKRRESNSAESLYEAAEGFVPEIRRRALKMERARRLDDDLVDAMDAAGLFSVIVPKRWGGAGLGPREVNEVNRVSEILGSADCSTAWVSTFFIFHNWFLCRFPLEVQQQLYKERSSVRCAAVWAPPGSAERVAGGYRITGRWGYASGVLHAPYALVSVIVDNSAYWFIVRREDLEMFDDWDMASMVATGSVTIATKDTFVSDGWGLEIAKLMSAGGHAGTFYAEDIYRQSFSVLSMATPSLSLGALDSAVELGRERLRTSKPFGIPRIERVPSRIRWVRAYETARVARLIRDTVTENAIQRAQSGRPLSLQDEACMGLHGVSVMQGIKDAARLLVDGCGTSGYRADDQIRRISSDLAMISTHLLGGDYDVVMDRHARWVLGLGMEAGDPVTRFA
jgi:3-hydroxy-9,10-secoandrosta-1,3,5(10)-triene-9,17-dione monooxygenase